MPADRGLGLALVTHLLGLGRTVVAAAREPGDSLRELGSRPGLQSRLSFVPLDVMDPGSIQARSPAAR